jgi:sterol desaturase/sphingolipid hydroxylase (fatty acid hydroxylase superfamily)
MKMFSNLLREYVNILLSVLILTLIFSFLELLAPAEKGQAVSKRLFNLLYLPFALALVILLQFLLAPYYSRALSIAGGGLLPEFVNGQSGFVAHLLFALFYAVVFDIWQYWAHRLQHTIPFFWETHKFHHSETALNSSTIARTHVLSNLLFIFLYLPVLIILGPQTPHFIALFLMFKLWGFVNHTNVRFNLGPLTPIISGPHWHRIHHSLYVEHHSKNFATFFPFIDILFGTYHRPVRNEYPPTGLPAEESESFLREATISPFSTWHKMIARRLGRFKSRRIVRFRDGRGRNTNDGEPESDTELLL